MVIIGHKNGQEAMRLERHSFSQADADAYAGSIDSFTLEGGAVLTPTVNSNPLPGIIADQSGRESTARTALTKCKSTCLLTLVAGGMSETDAYEAGVNLIADYAAELWAYEFASGNSIAKQKLIAAIVADPPAWWGPAYLAIFEDAL